MRVIGIDPGISHTGYGIVDVNDRGRLIYLDSGSINSPSRLPFVERLSKIHIELQALFQRYQPQHMAVEEIFFAKNVRSALVMGHARGVALLSASLAGIPVYEYAATEIKMAICRYGRADKEQVKAMVSTLLNIKISLSSHAADSLAACICHIHKAQTDQKIKANST